MNTREGSPGRMTIAEIRALPEDRAPSPVESEAFVIAQGIIEDLAADSTMPIDEQRDMLDELALAVDVLRDKADTLRASLHGGVVYRAPREP